MTMKTTMLAAVAVLALGVGSAFAGEGDGNGTVANTFFTLLPRVVAQAPTQQAPSAVARNQTGGGHTAAFVTSHRSGTWLFAPYQGNG
jgi:hypothetical protein